MDMFSYTIEPGDTLQNIASRFNTSVNLIAQANPQLDPEHLVIGQIICIPSLFQRNFYIHNISNKKGYSMSEVDFMDEIRMLWEQHIAWTRMTIISMVENLPDTDAVTNRLLRNPTDFAMILKFFYGDEAALKFEELFKNHLIIASELVKAATKGDSKAAEDAEKRWYENADEIAAFLADLNPFWSEDMWKEMMYDHLALTKSEATNRIQKNYEQDITIYDEIENQAMKMADLMSQGIIRQFPDKF